MILHQTVHVISWHLLLNLCPSQRVLGSPASFLWLPLRYVHCIHLTEESLKILEISEHLPSVLMQGRSWQVIGGIRNLFSGSLDPPCKHHLDWFLGSNLDICYGGAFIIFVFHLNIVIVRKVECRVWFTSDFESESGHQFGFLVWKFYE